MSESNNRSAPPHLEPFDEVQHPSTPRRAHGKRRRVRHTARLRGWGWYGTRRALASGARAGSRRSVPAGRRRAAPLIARVAGVFSGSRHDDALAVRDAGGGAGRDPVRLALVSVCTRVRRIAAAAAVVLRRCRSCAAHETVDHWRYPDRASDDGPRLHEAAAGDPRASKPPLYNGLICHVTCPLLFHAAPRRHRIEINLQ